MQNMPQHDPGPARYEDAALAWARYKKLMTWMALAAALAVVAALVYLRLTVEVMPIGMIIAAIAGVGLSVLLGTALMGLVFLSNRGGHDDAASGRDPLDD
jgi:multidrug transporter EmrE-like cation transporter